MDTKAGKGRRGAGRARDSTLLAFLDGEELPGLRSDVRDVLYDGGVLTSL